MQSRLKLHSSRIVDSLPGRLAFILLLSCLYSVPLQAQATLSRIELYTVTTATAFCGGGVMMQAELRLVGSGAAGDPLNWTIRRRNVSQQSAPFDVQVNGAGADLGVLQVITVTTGGMSPLQNGDIVEVFAFWDNDPTVASRKVIMQCSAAGNHSVVGTLSDQPGSDDNGNGRVEAGESIAFNATVFEQGSTHAQAASLTLPFGSTVTASQASIRSTPIARDDRYTVVGNVHLQRAAPGLLANDTDPDGQPGLRTLPVTNATTLRGGQFSLQADGAFVYHPPLAFEGRDRLAYFVEDADGNRDQAVVTLLVNDVVWFVDNARPGNGDGRFNSPFNNLAAMRAIQGAGGAAAKAGDYIFLHSGSAPYEGGLSLLNNQRLLGQGVALKVQGQTITSAGLRPTLTNSAGTALNLGQDNVVHGLNIAQSAGDGLSGSGFGSLEFSTASIINVSSAALRLSNGTIAMNVDALSSQGSSSGGVALDNIAGSLTVGNSTAIINAAENALRISGSPSLLCDFGQTNLSAAAGDALRLNANPAALITFASLNVLMTNGNAVRIVSSGSVAVAGSSNTIDATGGAALEIHDTQLGGGWTIASLSCLNSSVAGLHLSNLQGELRISTSAINNAAAAALDIDGGSDDISVGGSISNSAGRAVLIANRSGGRVNIGANVNETGTGILLSDNDAGGPVIDFSASVTIVNSAGDAFRLNANSGASIAVQNLSIDNSVSAQRGIAAEGGGSLQVSSGSVTCNNVALDIDGLSIDLSLRSVRSVDSPGFGVELRDLGANSVLSMLVTTSIVNPGREGLRVGGIAGGSLLDFADLGISGRNTTGALFSNVAGGITCGNVVISNEDAVGAHGLRIQGSSGAFTFASLTLRNTVQTLAETQDANGRPTNEGDGDAVFLLNNSGSVAIRGGLLDNIAADGIDARNSAALSLSDMTIEDTGESAGTSGNSGLRLRDMSGENTIDNCTFRRNKGSNGTAIFVRNSNSDGSLTIAATTLTNGQSNNGRGLFLDLNGGSDVDLRLEDGTLIEGFFGPGFGLDTINEGNFSGTLSVTMANITVDGLNGGLGGLGGGGVDLLSGATGTLVLDVHDSMFEKFAGANINAFVVAAQNSSTVRATMRADTVRTASRQGFRIRPINSSVVDVTIDDCLIDTDYEGIFALFDENSTGVFSISDNKIGTVTALTRHGIEFRTRDNSAPAGNPVRLLVDNNTVRINSSSRETVDIDVEGTSNMEVTFINNTLSNLGTDNTCEIDVEAATASLCLDIRSNSATGPGDDFNLDNSGGTFRVEGPGTNAVTAGDIQSAQTSGSASVSGTINFNNNTDCQAP